ncbi:hypothetical protein EXE58_13395 [Nocardioides seonyuensis]|uniref:Sulfotransferase domain-containing protein n=1 Tax=Nocardioides seonyuensis TaxID=2518371 RepID=A0A4P7II12_9ACTN|nr:sulfotransferase [Nocardioides seonyuensis]QBX56363.1 hypothetical protein EXE58_13395 [Nocardioides seonyuensis]
MSVPAPDARGRMTYDFSIVGVQKSGTTTLAWALRQHPDVCRPPRKEIHFFDREDYDWDSPDYARDYTAPRRAARHRMMGDATPTYLFWPHALERMHDYRPDMPLIAIFRDPLERLFSHWAHLRARVMPWVDWPKFIRRFAETSLPAELPAGVKPVRYGHMSGIARGYYGEQLRRGFDVFPREQWLLLEFREMFADFEGTLDAVTDHLELARFAPHPPLSQRNAGDAGVVGTPPTGEQLERIAAMYGQDLELFAELSGIDTTAWPTRRILEGTLDPDELAARFAAKINRGAES